MTGLSLGTSLDEGERVAYYAPIDTDERLYYLVAWRGDANVVFIESENDKITVNGKVSTIDPHGQTVYALQPDLSLRAVPLSDEEHQHILNLFDIYASEAARWDDPLWRDKVLPSLQWVPPIQQARPSK